MTQTKHSRIKEAVKVGWVPAVIAALCCLSPIVLVLFGLGTAASAAALSDVLYGQYQWAFLGAGLLALAVSLFFYFRRKGICTVDQAKRQRNKILNTALFVLGVTIGLYVVWNFVILELIGYALGIWEIPILT